MTKFWFRVPVYLKCQLYCLKVDFYLTLSRSRTKVNSTSHIDSMKCDSQAVE